MMPREEYERLLNSFPPHLLDTHEARTLIAWVLASWEAPLHPERVRQLREQWNAFVAANPPPE